MAAFGLAETAELAVRISLKDDLSRGINGLTTKVNRLQTGLGKVGTGLKNAARNLAGPGLVAGGLFAFAIKSGLEDLSELESAVTSVDGAIKQMGLTGKLTGQQVADWANEIEANTGAAFDDKAITQATTTLIRYGKVTEKNIRPAMEIITDLAAKTGDVESASTLLAKALADPAKAAGKLSRQGIILTDQQKDQIDAMLEVNDLAGAQAVLLDAVAKSTEGAANASQGKYARALSVLSDVQEDARKALAEGFLPVIEKVATLLSTELAKPQTLNNIREFGQSLAKGLDSLIEIARNLPWGTIGDSLKIAGAGAKAVLTAFTSLPPWVQTAVLTGWGLNKLTGGLLGDLASGLVKGVLGMNAGVVNIRAGVVNGAGGLAGAAGKGGGLLGGAAKLALGLTGVGIAAALASEFEDEIQGLAQNINTGWRQAVDDTLGVKIPTLSPKDLEWPFGPKNTPTILPEIFGGNGLLGGAGAPVQRRPTAATTGAGAAAMAANAASIGAREASKVNFAPLKGAIDSVKTAVTVTNQATKNAIANASLKESAENGQQRAELGNIKNTVATQAAQQQALQRAQLVAQAANTLMVSIQGAGQAVRDAVATNATRTAGTTAAAASRSAGSRTAVAMSSAASRIVGAIYAARPIIQPTNVIERYTTIVRSGSTSGSRNSGPLR